MAYKAVTGSPDFADVLGSGFMRTVARCFRSRRLRSMSAPGLSDDARRQLQRDGARAQERVQRLGSITRPL